MSSDELEIDPDLDKEDEHDVTTGNVEPARTFSNFFTNSSSAASSSAGQNAPTKKKATRRLKVAPTDTKQTRLGAGLKPIRLQLDLKDTESNQVAAADDSTLSTYAPVKGNPKKTQKRRDEEDQETREMEKLAKGDAASKKPVLSKRSRGKGKVSEEVETDPGIKPTGETSKHLRDRKGAKRKSTATYPSDNLSSNSAENVIHISDSPDRVTSSKTSMTKRRKFAQTEDSPASAIDVDTSFEQDDEIEIVKVLKPNESAVGRVNGQVPSGKTTHPFFVGNPRSVRSNSVETFSEREADLNDVASILTTPETSKPNLKRAKEGVPTSHVFFQKKGRPETSSAAVSESIGMSFPSGPQPLPAGKAGWGKGEPEGGNCTARFPDAEEQHVQPYPMREPPCATRTNALQTLPKRLRTRSQTGTREDPNFWQKIYPKESELDVQGSEQAEDDPRSTAPEVRFEDTLWTEAPAVRALQSKARNTQTSGTKLWIDKYKPLSAAEVLGNRIPADYLVSWLKELALGTEVKNIPGESKRPNPDLTPKKRKFLTKVKRMRKKKDREDDWIVDDTLDPIDDYLSADGTDTTGTITDDEHAPGMDIASGTSVYPTFQSRLANSILLQGPHGCGKTAAVYAAAAELGWEVFEVNPGSKRSGAQLSAMVGEVGKNHMVGRSGHVGQEAVLMDKLLPEEREGLNAFKRNTLAAAFDRANGSSSATATSVIARGSTPADNPFLGDKNLRPKNGLAATCHRQEAMSDVGSFGFIANGHGKSAQSKDIRQSLILFEEVDILYEEDQGFWPQVVELIATSKRPVIMTCNDLGMIPFERLPLQCTLLFSPPDAASLKPYLLNIGKLERAPAVSDTYLSKLMSAASFSHPSALILQQPLAPVSLRQTKGIDMRMAIMQLQLDIGCSRKITSETLRGTPRQRNSLRDGKARLDLRRSNLAVEARSYVDAYMSLGSDMIADVVDVDRFKPSADDEEGTFLIQKPALSLNVPVLSGSNSAGDIAKTFWELAGNITSIEEEEQDVVFNLALDREDYQLSTLPFLDPVIPLEAHLLPSPVLFTSYIPAIANMVDIDDRLEREDAIDAAQGRPRKNRKSGRMMRLTATTASVPSYVRQLVAIDEIGEVGLKAVRDCRLDFGLFPDEPNGNQEGHPSNVGLDS